MRAQFGRFVAYYRVSTGKQRESGLGLDAQRAAVMNYLNGGPWKLVAEHTEVERGKRNARPELKKALAGRNVAERPGLYRLARGDGSSDSATAVDRGNRSGQGRFHHRDAAVALTSPSSKAL